MLKTLFLLLVLAAPCVAQDVCDLNLQTAPSLFNLRLGMTQQDVRVSFGKQIKFKPKKNGTRTFFENFIKKPSPPILPNVRALYLRFFQNRLYQIEIFFEETDKQQTLDEFKTETAARLNLPNIWQTVRGKNQIQCSGFKVAALKTLNPKIELTDDAGLAAFENEQKAEEAKKKKG